MTQASSLFRLTLPIWLLLAGVASAQTANGPLLGGPIATQLEKAEVTGTGIGLSTGGSGNYTVDEVKLLPALTEEELAGIAASLPPPVSQAAFVRAVEAYYVASELDPDFYGEDGLPLHPLPPGMVVDIVASITLPDGRRKGPLAHVTDGRYTISTTEPGSASDYYGTHFEVGIEDGQMTISRLVTYSGYAIAIKDMVMNFGATATMPLPDGGSTTITATYRQASATELNVRNAMAAGMLVNGYPPSSGTTINLSYDPALGGAPGSVSPRVAAQATVQATADAARTLEQAMANLRANPPAQLPR